MGGKTNTPKSEKGDNPSGARPTGTHGGVCYYRVCGITTREQG